MTAKQQSPANDGNNTDQCYPEHEKLGAINQYTQAIHDFLTWLGDEHEVYLAKDIDHAIGAFAMRTLMEGEIKDLMAKFYDIDLKLIEKEKTDMLNRLREANGSK